MANNILTFWQYFLHWVPQLNTGIYCTQFSCCSFRTLEKAVRNVHKDLSIVIVQIPSEIPRLHIITKGKPLLKKYAYDLLACSPKINWNLVIGIPPWEKSFEKLIYHYRLLGPNTAVYQIYFAVENINKLSGKLDLIIYMEKNVPLSKHQIKNYTKTILLFYLGDEIFHDHIGHLKVVLRKFSYLNFAPMSQLKKLLEFSLT